MNIKKTIYSIISYFILISILFFASKYLVLKETEDLQKLIIESLVSGFIGSLILTYMLRRWSNNTNK